jgi:hypothetical protein
VGDNVVVTPVPVATDEHVPSAALAEMMQNLATEFEKAGYMLVDKQWSQRAQEAMGAVARLRSWLEPQVAEWQAMKAGLPDGDTVPVVNASAVLDQLDPNGGWSKPAVNEEAAAPAEDVEAAADRDGVHLVRFGEKGWMVRHPDRCKASDGGLFECPVNDQMPNHPPGELGVYRCWLAEDGQLCLGEKVAEA